MQGVELVVPPLRERREDIVLLVEHFLALECERTGRRVDLERKTIDRLLEYHWPGNVRELENEIRRLIVLGSGRIGPDDLAIPSAEKALEGALRPGALDGMTWVEAREALDRAFFQEALKRCKGSLAEVARYLGVHERSVYKLRRRLKLEP